MPPGVTGQPLDQPQHDHAKHGREGHALDPGPRGAEDVRYGPSLCNHPIDEVQGTVDPIAVLHHCVHQLRWPERIVDLVQSPMSWR